MFLNNQVIVIIFTSSRHCICHVHQSNCCVLFIIVIKQIFSKL